MGLKIAMITPWNCKCGIFSYSKELSLALAQEDVDVYIVRLPRFGAKNNDILLNVLSKIPIDKVDLIHVQDEYGLYQGLEPSFFGVLKRLGKPVVTTMHAIGQYGLDAAIAEASSRVIVHNEFCRKTFGFPSTIIPHGTKPVKCPPIEECKKTYGVSPKAPLVGYIGFISNIKGIEKLIEAVSKIPKIGLVIGGGWHIDVENEYIAKLKELAAMKLQGRCQWLGFIPDEKLAEVYGSFDVLCYPSNYGTESGGLLLGLSHGKAVIASNILPFLEKEQQGALMTFKDVDDLSLKIKELLTDDALRQKLEDGARKYAYENRWEVIAQKHINLYTEVINQCGQTVKPMLPA